MRGKRKDAICVSLQETEIRRLYLPFLSSQHFSVQDIFNKNASICWLQEKIVVVPHYRALPPSPKTKFICSSQIKLKTFWLQPSMHCQGLVLQRHLKPLQYPNSCRNQYEGLCDEYASSPVGQGLLL